MNIIFSDRAQIQLTDIQSYISAASGYPQRAKDFSGRIIKFCEGLRDFPNRGTMHDYIQDGLRIIGFEGSVTIAFVVEPERIYIHGIYYGGQNWLDNFDD